MSKHSLRSKIIELGIWYEFHDFRYHTCNQIITHSQYFIMTTQEQVQLNNVTIAYFLPKGH